MHCGVARPPDVLGLLPDRLGDELAEGRLDKVVVQVRYLRRAQGLVDLEDAYDQTLERMPCMKASRPRVAVDLALGQARALGSEGKLVLQEREVLGDLRHDSEIAVEGAGLQRCEESVEFGEVGALGGLLLFDGFGDGGEATLEVKRADVDKDRRIRVSRR